MTFSVRFVKKGAAHYPFAAAPFVAPEHTYEYDLSLPPRLVAIVKTWTLQGILYGAGDAALGAAWDGLKSKIEDPTSYPDGIELLRDAIVFESISAAGWYDDWRIERLSSPRTALQWRGELRFTLRVVGRRRLPTAGKVSKLTASETWAYDEAGLLTRTLTGDLEVTDGSATALARTLGLKVPGNTFAFVTAGPEGVDVVRLSPSDLKARFTSTIKESGAALPDQVGPSFVLETETTIRDGVATKTTHVTAAGPGAVAAIQAQVAAGRLHEATGSDPHRKTAHGTFVETKPETGTQVLKLHRFSVSGGNQPIAFTRRTGGRRPVSHALSYTPVDVVELIEVLTWGPPATASIKLPSPVAGLVEDRDAWRLVGPERTAIGKDETADTWTTRVTRLYRAAQLDPVFTPLFQSVLVPGAGTTLDDEVARIVNV
jgi:hypothetical protein